MWENAKPFKIELGGLNLKAGSSVISGAFASLPTPVAYPDALEARNVRWTATGSLKKRNGYLGWADTAMPGTKMAVTGLFPLNLRDGTTRYTIACSRDRIFLVPASGAWTALVSSLTGADSNLWSGTVFNNELILCNGVDAPQVTNGTTGGPLVNQTSVQSRTAMTSAQSLMYQLHKVEEGTLIAAGGASAAGSYDGLTQEYDTIGDTWATRQRANTNRDSGVGFTVDGQVYLSSGLFTGPALTLTGEVYNPVTDSWTTFANVTAARREGVGATGNNGGFSITGNTDASAAAWTTTNYFYDPITNVWSTKTVFGPDAARRQAAGFNLSDTPHVLAGKITAADAYDAEHSEYNPFADAWTDLTDLTATRALAQGCGGQDNKGYIVGGYDSSAVLSAVIYSYTRPTNAFATLTATLGTARSIMGVAADDWMVYVAGGAVGASASAVVERFTASPAAPIAKYVTSYKGQVVMAASTAYPSRMFYSAPGNARTWDPFSYIDINPDDGRSITGIFVYDGRLYVSKSELLYLISGDAPFDPLEAVPAPVPLEGTVGTNAHRSVIVTNIGVFYQSEHGFMLFDGSRSVHMGEHVFNLVYDSSNPVNFAYTCGVWNKRRSELWWGLYIGSTMYVLVFNTMHKKWSMFANMDTYSMTVREDSYGYDEIIFGPLSTTNSRIYVADYYTGDLRTADVLNGSTLTAIDSAYQTGWFSPDTGLNLSLPKDLFMYWKRVATTTPTVSLRGNYSSSDPVEAGVTQTDAIVLTAGNKTNYFEDGTDQRCRIQAPAASTSHALSLRITETSTNAAWELYGAILTASSPPADGGFPAP